MEAKPPSLSRGLRRLCRQRARDLAHVQTQILEIRYREQLAREVSSGRLTSDEICAWHPTAAAWRELIDEAQRFGLLTGNCSTTATATVAPIAEGDEFGTPRAVQRDA